PEDRRSGAGRDPGTAAATVVRRRGRGRPLGRLRRCRHGRVPRQCRRGCRRGAGVPGDEHPAAGRAPGDRGGDRPRPGRAAAVDRRGRSAAVRRAAAGARARDRGPPLRRGSRPPGDTPGVLDPRGTPPGTPGVLDPRGTPPGTPGVLDPRGTPPGTPGVLDPRGTPPGTPGVLDPRGTPPGTPGALSVGWRPSTGTLHRIAVPGGVRVDAGVVDGDAVSAHYDPLLAKVVAHGPSRPAAARKLAAALAGASLHGLVTNRDLLVRVLRSDGFAAGPHTGFLDEQPALLAPLAGSARRRASAPVQRSVPAGWRNNPSQPATATYAGPDGDVTVSYRPAPVTVVSATPDT